MSVRYLIVGFGFSSFPFSGTPFSVFQSGTNAWSKGVCFKNDSMRKWWFTLLAVIGHNNTVRSVCRFYFDLKQLLENFAKLKNLNAHGFNGDEDNLWSHWTVSSVYGTTEEDFRRDFLPFTANSDQLKNRISDGWLYFGDVGYFDDEVFL